jgi:hypothetical protein
VNAAERILLSLDAHECWAGGARALRPPSAPPEVLAAGALAAEALAIAHPIHDDFGGLLDWKSVSDLKDLVTQTGSRRAELDRWYAQASPIWVRLNPNAFTDFTNDRVAFNARFDAAMAKAKSVVDGAKYAVMTPDAMLPATDEYTALARAMRACYPPDGCPVVKGDWVDLFNRATSVSPSLKIPAPTDKTYQPTAADMGRAVLAATAPLDVVAQVTGAQSTATGPLPQQAAEAIKEAAPKIAASTGEVGSMLLWLAEHQRALVIGAVVVVGGIGLLSILPVLMLPAKAAKGLTLAAKAATLA